MSRSIVVVTAGLTVPSSTRLLADQIAEATSAQVSARGEAVDVEFVELREVASELATFMVTGGIPTPRITQLRERVAAADGLIAVAAGAGGHAGRLSPFAIIQEIRQWFDGPLALSGSIATGDAVLAAQAMGAD